MFSKYIRLSNCGDCLENLPANVLKVFTITVKKNLLHPKLNWWNFRIS